MVKLLIHSHFKQNNIHKVDNKETLANKKLSTLQNNTQQHLTHHGKAF